MYSAIKISENRLVVKLPVYMNKTFLPKDSAADIQRPLETLESIWLDKCLGNKAAIIL